MDCCASNASASLAGSGIADLPLLPVAERAPVPPVAASKAAAAAAKPA
jgi:hypothetical protein